MRGLALLLVAVAACGDGACPYECEVACRPGPDVCSYLHGDCPEDDGGDGAAGAPRITDFDFVRQFPGDPYTLVFGIEFEDDGDLGTGTRADVYLNCNLQDQWVEIDELFLQAGIPFESEDGELALALRFDNVEADMELTVGTQLFDAAGLRSNYASVTLEFY